MSTVSYINKLRAFDTTPTEMSTKACPPGQKDGSKRSQREPPDIERVPTAQEIEASATMKNLDDEVLRLQGHVSAMPRSFSPIASVGLAFAITGSWVGYLSCFGANIIFAGPQNVVLGLVIGTVVQWIITLGLSEIASAFPSSGVSISSREPYCVY